MPSALFLPLARALVSTAAWRLSSLDRRPAALFSVRLFNLVRPELGAAEGELCSWSDALLVAFEGLVLDRAHPLRRSDAQVPQDEMYAPAF